jgi:hypothetical protein
MEKLTEINMQTRMKYTQVDTSTSCSKFSWVTVKLVNPWKFMTESTNRRMGYSREHAEAFGRVIEASRGQMCWILAGHILYSPPVSSKLYGGQPIQACDSACRPWYINRISKLWDRNCFQRASFLESYCNQNEGDKLLERVKIEFTGREQRGPTSWTDGKHQKEDIKAPLEPPLQLFSIHTLGRTRIPKNLCALTGRNPQECWVGKIPRSAGNQNYERTTVAHTPKEKFTYQYTAKRLIMTPNYSPRP